MCVRPRPGDARNTKMSKRCPLWSPQPGGITVGTQIRFRPDRPGEGVVLVKSVCRGGSRRMEEGVKVYQVPGPALGATCVEFLLITTI